MLSDAATRGTRPWSCSRRLSAALSSRLRSPSETPELLQVGVGQVGQDVHADVAAAEGGRVPLQAQAAQPVPDVHALPPARSDMVRELTPISPERTMNRHARTDREWGRLAPLLPRRPRTGGPPKDRRLIIDALLWLSRTGAPWRDLPERFGPWRTVAAPGRREACWPGPAQVAAQVGGR